LKTDQYVGRWLAQDIGVVERRPENRKGNVQAYAKGDESGTGKTK
jgi:hypothetical protein